MAVPVMDVGEMDVRVGERLVLMLVGVRFFPVPPEGMRMLMVLIVAVAMRVHQPPMHMLVRVALGEM